MAYPLRPHQGRARHQTPMARVWARARALPRRAWARVGPRVNSRRTWPCPGTVTATCPGGGARSSPSRCVRCCPALKCLLGWRVPHIQAHQPSLVVEVQQHKHRLELPRECVVDVTSRHANPLHPLCPPRPPLCKRDDATSRRATCLWVRRLPLVCLDARVAR